MKHLVPLLLSILILSSAYAAPKATEKRIAEVARRGVHVMPFDLDLSTHVFSKTAKGGVQDVIAKNPNNPLQIKLIREHLTKISRDFRQGDFSDPAKIHGDNMPGLKKLRKANQNQLKIVYKELPMGASIKYSSDDPALISAIHQWFDAQLNDHARHATSGHTNHKMHHQ